jgi:hypothetical protein
MGRLKRMQPFNLLVVTSLILCMVSCFTATARGGSVILIGMVEERNIDAFNQTTQEDVRGYETNLRIAFQKAEIGWKTVCPSKPAYSRPEDCHFPNPDKERTWHVFYRGKTIGKVVTSGWHYRRFYKDAGSLRIVSKQVPRVGARSEEFIGWGDQTVYRPLVALNTSIKAKPDPWEEASPTHGDLKMVWPSLSKIIKDIPNCKFAEPDGPKGKPSQLKPEDVEVFRVLTSGRGDRLIGARVKAEMEEKDSGCGGFTSDLWFFSKKNSALLPLVAGSLKGWRFRFVPIDFGDFDGDGSPEALFWFSGYDEDGYVLFTKNFQKSVRFTWLYH